MVSSSLIPRPSWSIGGSGDETRGLLLSLYSRLKFVKPTNLRTGSFGY